MTWEPTHAHLRALAFGAVLAVVGVAGGRGDLVVLAAPFVVIAVWSAATRPDLPVQVETPVTRASVHEGEESAWPLTLHCGPGVRQALTLLPAHRWLEVEPEGGLLSAVSPGTATTRLALRSTRWGRRRLAPAAVAAYGVWNGFRFGPVRSDRLHLTTLPVPSPPRAGAPTPHPRGLVGMERAVRGGEGTEFAKVRRFQPGDRLRRIHWPVSARTGELHVTATYADEDAVVMVLLDAINDVGESAGLDGRPSSMDVTVRAAAAVAEHFLHRGDRVGLRVFGAWGVSRVPAASGHLQLRRIVDSLSLVEPGTARGETAQVARLGLGAGTLAIMLSPFADPAAAGQVVSLTRAGLDVIVVDTLPEGLRIGGDRRTALAWRLRQLERRLELDRLAELGIPVIGWTGPAGLDVVLRELARRRTAPREVRR